MNAIPPAVVELATLRPSGPADHARYPAYLVTWLDAETHLGSGLLDVYPRSAGPEPGDASAASVWVDLFAPEPATLTVTENTLQPPWAPQPSPDPLAAYAWVEKDGHTLGGLRAGWHGGRLGVLWCWEGPEDTLFHLSYQPSNTVLGVSGFAQVPNYPGYRTIRLSTPAGLAVRRPRPHERLRVAVADEDGAPTEQYLETVPAAVYLMPRAGTQPAGVSYDRPTGQYGGYLGMLRAGVQDSRLTLTFAWTGNRDRLFDVLVDYDDGEGWVKFRRRGFVRIPGHPFFFTDPLRQAKDGTWQYGFTVEENPVAVRLHLVDGLGNRIVNAYTDATVGNEHVLPGPAQPAGVKTSGGYLGDLRAVHVGGKILFSFGWSGRMSKAKVSFAEFRLAYRGPTDTLYVGNLRAIAKPPFGMTSRPYYWSDLVGNNIWGFDAPAPGAGRTLRLTHEGSGDYIETTVGFLGVGEDFLGGPSPRPVPAHSGGEITLPLPDPPDYPPPRLIEDQATPTVALELFTAPQTATPVAEMTSSVAAGEGTLTAAVAPAHYKLRVSPLGAPPGRVTLNWASEADLPVLTLIVLSDLPQTPSTLRVTVTDAEPDEDVTFTIDEVADDEGHTLTVDDTGTLVNVALLVDADLSAGTYTLRALTPSRLAATAAFTVLADPDERPTDLPADALPVAVAQSGVRRWVLQDPAPGGVSYIFPFNPESMSSPYPDNVLTPAPSTASDGQVLTWEGASQGREFTFRGYLETQDFYDTLAAFTALNRQLWLIDHRNRAWVISLEQFDPTPVRNVNKPWAHRYDMRAIIYRGPVPMEEP